MGSPTLSRGPDGPREDAGVGIRGGGGCHRSSSSSRRPSSVVHHRRHRWPSAVLVASSSPSPLSSERDNPLAVAGDDDVFVRRPCRASSCCPCRGAAWLLLCGCAARQCRWVFKEAATHLRWVVGAPPTWLEPCPPSSIVVVVAVVRTAWPIGQSRCRQHRQSSLSVGAAAALLMGADAHVQVVSVGSGLDAAMYAPVLVVDTPPFSHLRRRPSRSSSLLSESCELSSSS